MKFLATTATLLAAALILSAPALAQGSDSCATPTVISGVGPHAFNTVAGTTGAEGQANGACNFNGSTAIENDVWFHWTASSSGTAIVSFCQQTIVDTKVAVYAATACPSTAPVACDDDGCGAQSLVSFIVNTGDTFVIQVGTAPFATPGTGNFTIHMAPSATSDDCATPTVISGPGEFPFDNRLAGGTGPVNPGCVTVKRNVWYQWTAPVAGTAHMDLCGRTSLDSNIAVYAGAGCPASTSLACDDDGCGLESRVSWPVSAGSVYALELGSASSSSTGFGTFVLYVQSPPANDDCSTPFVLWGGGTAWVNTHATTGSQGQANPCGGIDQDMWWTWTASVNGPAAVSACSTPVDTSIAVYVGGGCPAGVALACNDDGASCAPGSEVWFAASAGTTYLIQIGCKPGSPPGPGSFSLYQLGGGVPGSSYCVPGVAGVAGCPCSNPPSPADRGCDNSSSTGGAQLTATGTASLSSDTVVFTSSGEKPTAGSIFLQGNVNVPFGAVFGQGIRCVGGSLKRLYVHNAVGGVVSAPVGADPTVSARSAALGDTIASGTTRFYAVYYRDATVLGGCPAASTFNVSQSQLVPWGP